MCTCVYIKTIYVIYILYMYGTLYFENKCYTYYNILFVLFFIHLYISLLVPYPSLRCSSVKVYTRCS